MEKFAALVNSLARRGIPVMLLLGPMEDDPPVDPENADRIITLRPESVRDLGALVSSAKLFVSADTGPMHLAAAVGTVCLSIFTEAVRERFAPLGDNHKVLHDPDGRLDPDTVAEEIARMVVRT